MKSTTQLLWLFLGSIAAASPFKIDVNVQIETEDLATENAKPNRVTPVRISPSRVRQLAATSTGPGQPIDLGYEIHKPSPWKDSDSYYAFENIPYAKQPVGNLRFKAAKAFDDSDYPDDPPVNDGSKYVVCPQENVGWFKHASDWSTTLFNPKAVIDQKFNSPYKPENYPSMPKPNPAQNESCLMLDVFVPRRIYDDQNANAVPVIVSFHGGGFIFGSKNITGNPSGILKAAGEKGPEGDVIVVSVNYRLGAFGWLSGPDFVEAGGYENAGLSDQNAALDWVSNHIFLFGGNTQEITALGESAGASSILHHLTAYGIDRRYHPRPKFNKAVIQSPAFFPQVSPRKQNQTYHAFLEAAGVSDFAGLQKADTAKLIAANSKTTYNSPYGTFTYGPVVSERKNSDDSYIQYPPSLKLAYGSWFSSVNVMVSGNRREGALFTPPWLRNEPDLAAYIKGIYPAMSNESFEEFAKLYPVPQTKIVPVIGTVPTDARERFLYAAAAFGDLGVDCTPWLLSQRVYNKDTSYRYFYRIYPGFHGQDVGATWYPEAGKVLTNPLFNSQMQSERLQRYITCFAKEDGNPNCLKDKHDDKEFKSMSEGAMWIGNGVPVLNLKGEQIPDEVYFFEKDAKGDLPSEDVCSFWSSAPYYEEDPEMMRALRTQGGWAQEL